MPESIFNHITNVPAPEPFKLTADYNADGYPQKVNLGVGAYRDECGKPWILPVVKKAETELAKDINEEKINHEYLPVLGFGKYSDAATKLILGADSKVVLLRDCMTCSLWCRGCLHPTPLICTSCNC